METLLGLIVGVSLAAACGFRIFVPLLVMSLAAASGHLHLAPGFEWMASPVAVLAFGVATACEILAYYVPVIDHALDTLAAPAAVVAGTLATAACIGHMSPFLTWSIAAIVGGGAAASVQGLTTVTRAASLLTTGGLGNPVIATGEAGGSALLAGLSIGAPFVALALTFVLVFFTLRTLWRFLHRRSSKGEQIRYAAQASPSIITIRPERVKVHAEWI